MGMDRGLDAAVTVGGALDTMGTVGDVFATWFQRKIPRCRDWERSQLLDLLTLPLMIWCVYLSSLETIRSPLRLFEPHPVSLEANFNTQTCGVGGCLLLSKVCYRVK